MASGFAIRSAKPADLAGINEIYGYHALHGFGTFDTEPPPKERFEARLAELDAAGHPFLVMEEGGRIIGFAYAAPFRPRAGWRISFEDTIYMAPGFERQGLGSQLLGRLIDECRRLGVRQVIAVIGDSQNRGSIRVHERLGFVHVGTLRDVGIKQDRLLDVVLMQLFL